MSASGALTAEQANFSRQDTKTQSINADVLKGVRVALEVRLGEAPMTVEEMMALKSGAVVSLTSNLADHVELFLNGTLVARGEIVAVGEKFGVRIVELGPTP